MWLLEKFKLYLWDLHGIYCTVLVHIVQKTVLMTQVSFFYISQYKNNITMRLKGGKIPGMTF